jgi:hypothetical protein
METRTREKVLHEGEAKKVETLSAYTDEYIVKSSKFGKLHKNFSGHFSYREEEGKIIIKPSCQSIFDMMRSWIGRNHFKPVNN